ncbi:MAG TPA: glycosyltransferase family 4 protein, partial [Candidatus Baltobacteraceae bacterium]|nr:glycosyltransferase family 4 protein [Candidatus Baltobacteraceae bacterium]
ERVDSEGGTETYLRSILPALRDGGHDLRVIARSTAVPDAYGVPSLAVPWSDEHDPPSLQAAASVDAIARDFAPDVTVVHNVLDAGVVSAAARRSPRSIYHLHDHRPFCPNGDRLYPQGGGLCGVPMGARTCGVHSLLHGCAYGPRPRTLALVGIRERVAQTVRNAGATIAFSHYVAELARRNGVAGERIQVLPPPLDDAAYATAPAARPSTDCVLFAGRVVPSKGARSLVRALARIEAPRRPLLRIAGDGPDLQPTLEDARQRGVETIALGRLDAPALRRAYDDATVVAFPSLWGEPFGLVGIEAFARGRPVVAYDVGAVSEWLEDRAGRRVDRGDESALAFEIRRLLEPGAWNDAARNAWRAAQAYRLDDHVLRLEALYGRR